MVSNLRDVALRDPALGIIQAIAINRRYWER